MTDATHNEFNCRLCNGLLTYKFSKLILQKYYIKYYACNTCHSLQTEEPYWIGEAYALKDYNIDTGALQRNINNFAISYTISQIFSVKTAVDYGAKDGINCRFLRDHEINCYAYDKYSMPSYVVDFTTPPKNNIDLLMAFEVLEHLTNPQMDLEEIFAFNPKYFLCSTLLYNNHNVDWFYLAPEHGQHVFFYSARAINFIAQKYGYLVTRFGGVGGVLFFYKPEISNIQNMIISAKTALNGWIFQAIKSYIFLLPTKGVQVDNELIRTKLSLGLANGNRPEKIESR